VNRVLVLGSPGSGKSTLARPLARQLYVPYVSMDDHYWGRNWQRPDGSEWESWLSRKARLPKWLIDGNHARTLSLRAEHAEIALIVEAHPVLCAWRIIWRSVQIRRGRYEFAPALVAEGLRAREHNSSSRELRSLVRLALSFRRQTLPHVLETLEAYGVPILVVRNWESEDTIIARIEDLLKEAKRP